MENKYLKGSILEIVENQLRTDKPPCTKKTFERLTASGFTEKESKEMIGAVLIEQIYHVMKGERSFDEKAYAQGLEALPGAEAAAKDVTGRQEDGNIGVEALFSQIEYNDGSFPRDILSELVAREAEAVPVLLNILKKVKDNPQKYAAEPEYFGHIYAAFLLAQFGTAEAYPILIDMLRLPGELPYELFGDTITEDGGRILASVCGNDTGPLKSLIEDTAVDEFVRSQGVNALTILVLRGRLRSEVLYEYFRELLCGGLGDDSIQVISTIIYSCDMLHPAELFGEIENLYAEDKVDPWVISFESVKKTMRRDKAEVLREAQSSWHFQPINDTIEELENWYCFDGDFDDSDLLVAGTNNSQTIVKGPKIGRNDPCPCGSGKKYKKCCGKQC